MWLFDYLFTFELILFMKYYHKAMGSFTLSRNCRIYIVVVRFAGSVRSATPIGGGGWGDAGASQGVLSLGRHGPGHHQLWTVFLWPPLTCQARAGSVRIFCRFTDK